MIELITDSNLEEFKKLIRKAIFLTKDEELIFKSIPNNLWKEIFSKNFDGNYEYAKRLLLNQFKEIERIDTVSVNKEKQKIHNLDVATNMILNAYNKDQKIVYITDFDNDGSLAQSIINEYLNIDKEGKKNSILEYAQTMMGNARGINIEHLNHLSNLKGINKEEEFLIITADNGINSRQEVKDIQKEYPNVRIIITDHHNPDEKMVVEENDKCVIFNPHYKPTAFFEKYNISGAATVGVLLLNVLNKRLSVKELEGYKNNLEKIQTLFKVSNMLDYVETHPADKPEKDYIISKFLELQPLLNINNSISKIITGEITDKAIDALRLKIPNLNVEGLMQEAKNIHTQNNIAEILLNIKNMYGELSETEGLTKGDFQRIFLKELTNQEYFTKSKKDVNLNYIEQLRPLIFSYGADYNKNTFIDAMEDQMIRVFSSIRESESLMGKIIREGEVITKQRLENSVIAYADKDILSVFNRKFLNKVYNDENPGFSLTLDSIKANRVSGSFRSLYDIDLILPLKEKEKLEKKLNIKIETPGHKKAAGFIIVSRDEIKNPITENTIKEINEIINKNIGIIKKNEKTDNKSYLITDFNSIDIIDRINMVIRGNVSNFAYISPLIKLSENTVWTDTYTTKQAVLKDLIKDKKYGYININRDFHGGTLILPVELVRRVVENDYKDYLSLGYLNGGVFMVDRVVKSENVLNTIDLRKENTKEKLIKEAWEQDFKNQNIVKLDRKDIKDNPFFKYNDYGDLNFDLFERIVIGLIDSNNVDVLSVFDVEANGFGNSKLINFGATNYVINKSSGNRIDKKFFNERFYKTIRGEEYLLSTDEIDNLKKLSEKERDSLSLDLKKQVLIKGNSGSNGNYEYYLPKDIKSNVKQKKLPFMQIKNYVEMENDVLYNREIEATMMAFLIKDKDFKMPQEMINLTGITQELLDTYGKKTDEVDKLIIEEYKGKKVLFGAHNTPYDARVIRANLPKTYNLLKGSQIYDSALFAKEQKLAYDDVKVGYFEEIDGISGQIYFYNNEYSDFSLINFLRSGLNGYYPDRSGQYLLERDNELFYLVDKVNHEKIKINANIDKLILSLKTSGLPNTSVKYSVEKLSEQWMIHALLLCNEKFDIKYVDLTNYQNLSLHKEAIKFFQDNYHFDISEGKNISNFMSHYNLDENNYISGEELGHFVKEFLLLNKDIQQKFSDAWMYKKVLEIKDPTRLEITNDLIELVNYQTNIPKDKIRVIFDEAIKFKEKYKISSILYHEAHANGPYKTDEKGDVAFEDKLTLGLLSQREYNSYDHNVKPAIDYFNMVKVRARVAFEISDQLSDDIAQDSYSFRQGIQYDRDVVSEVVRSIKEKEDNLSNNNKKHLVKFKLNNDILPNDSAVYAITKKKVVLSRKDVEEHKKKLSFIMLYLQVESTLNGKSVNEMEKKYIKSILDANFELALKYKEELSDIYDYVEFNRKDDQTKKVIDKLKKILFEDIDKDVNIRNINKIDSKNLLIIEKVMHKLIKEIPVKNLTNDLKINIQKVNNVLKEFKMNFTPTTLEKAINEESEFIGFGNDKTKIGEKNFLDKVDINRQNLGNKLLKENLDLRFINNAIEYNKELVNSHKPKKMTI